MLQQLLALDIGSFSLFLYCYSSVRGLHYSLVMKVSCYMCVCTCMRVFVVFCFGYLLLFLLLQAGGFLVLYFFFTSAFETCVTQDGHKFLMCFARSYYEPFIMILPSQIIGSAQSAQSAQDIDSPYLPPIYLDTKI